jgi:S-adenosylmethionine decarboxylase proenzyme
MTQIAEAGLRTLPLGNQLIVDFYDCKCDSFDDLEWVENVMIEAANRASATIVDVMFHKFNPIGISGVVVISESHLAIHTWPEHRYAAIDVFTCGDILDSEAAISYLAKQFRCRKRSVTKVNRGDSGDLLGKAEVVREEFAVRDRLVPVGHPNPNIRPIED